jgi:O-antigen/teichoic acid export membrane protein
MLIRHAAVYMVSNVTTAVLGFACAAVFTRLFSPADYGVYLVANSVGAILSAALYTWVRLSVLRLEAQTEEADVRATAFGCYAASSGLLAVALPALLLVFRLSWPEAVGACLFAATIALFEMQLEMLRAKGQVKRYALGTAVRGFFMLLLGVGFHQLGFGGFGLSLSIALAYVLGSAVLAPAVWRRPVAAFSRPAARSMLTYGLPATMSGLALALHTATDRLVVTTMLGHATGGQYGVAADFTRQLILVPAMALGSAVVPAAVRAFSTGGPEAARRHLAESGEVMLALLLPAAVGLSLTGRDLASVVLGEQFRDTAALLIPLLSFVWLFQAISQNYVHLSFHMTGKGRGMMWQSLVSMGANLALILPLTYAFGLMGAASAVLAGEVVGVLAGFAFARSSFALPVEPRRIGRVVGATALMALAVHLVGRFLPEAGAVALGAKVATGVAAYAIGALLLNVGDGLRRLSAFRAARMAAGRRGALV